MDKKTQSALRQSCIEIARLAGQAILEIYQEDDLGVEIKKDDSPLTRADIASHKIIVAALDKLEPRLPILSEESTPSEISQRRDWKSFWLVDPLDGTKEFIKRNGEFTVNIALIENARPLMGVVYVPVSGNCYSGSATEGAFLSVNQAAEQQIQVRTPAATPPVVVGSRSHASPRVQAYLEKLGEHTLTAMGSSLKLCLVAAGEADLYPRLGPTMEWDTAAAHAVVQAAGGRVIRTDGTDLDYNQRDTLLNPEFLVLGDQSINWHTLTPSGTTHLESKT